MRVVDLVLSNFWWKITSILVAVILWSAIRYDIEMSRDQQRVRGPVATFVFDEIPVIVYQKASETNRYVLNPSLVRVKVKGNAEVLENVKRSEIKVIADLIKAPATNSFRVPLELDVGSELEVEFVEPREVAVQVLDVGNRRN